jgi:hypothetical protein
MEDNYMKMSKKSKDKDFKKGVDAILTATTLIRVQMKDGGLQREKEQIIDAWIATDNQLQRLAAEEYYNKNYNQNK